MSRPLPESPTLTTLVAPFPLHTYPPGHVAAPPVSCFPTRQLLGSAHLRVIRVMPNTPCLVGEAACAMCPGSDATAADMDLVEAMFKAVGVIVRVAESQMDGKTRRLCG